MSYMTRNERQRQLNVQLSVLSKFEPLNDYEMCLIIHSTPTFTIDTKQHYYSHQPALIQIEFVEKTSVVVLIETRYLPHRVSVFVLVDSITL